MEKGSRGRGLGTKGNRRLCRRGLVRLWGGKFRLSLNLGGAKPNGLGARRDSRHYVSAQVYTPNTLCLPCTRVCTRRPPAYHTQAHNAWAHEAWQKKCEPSLHFSQN
jgi:hypothetical protein